VKFLDFVRFGQATVDGELKRIFCLLEGKEHFCGDAFFHGGIMREMHAQFLEKDVTPEGHKAVQNLLDLVRAAAERLSGQEAMLPEPHLGRKPNLLLAPRYYGGATEQNIWALAQDLRYVRTTRTTRGRRLRW